MKFSSIYNIIAELFSLVIKSCTEDFFVRYSCSQNAGLLCALEQKRRKIQ